VSDREGAKALLAPLKERFPRLATLWVDGGYRGPFEGWVAAELGWEVEVVQHPGAGIGHVWLPAGAPPPPPRPTGFRVLPRRWVVERTFAWLGRNRRLAKDHEGRCETGAAWIDLAMIRLLAIRLAR
jgi:putative transposase